MVMEVTEHLLRALAAKEKALSDGRILAKRGAFRNAKRTDDGALLWGECQGSALYTLSVDLSGSTPILRCSCPVKPPPCKHILGFLAYFLEQPARFSPATPPAELQEKREKVAERAARREQAAARPRKVDGAAREKKTSRQREALDLLETMVLDLASAGLGTIDARRAERIVEQSRQLVDAYLKGAAFSLRRLAALATSKAGATGHGADEVFYALREPGDTLPDAERHRLMIRHLARLWAMVRKGQKALDASLEEGETQSDADAVLEELLGRDWKLAELKERGAVQRDLELIELAFERLDDRIREERIEHAFLADLTGGAIHVDRTMRPLDALGRVRGGQSYDQVVQLAEAVVYPGFVNRRIRWEPGAFRTRKITAADWERLHAAGMPGVDPAVARYKEQIKNPLAPDEAVLLVRVGDLRKAPDGLVLVDEQGARLMLRDSPLARCRSTNSLETAAGAVLEQGRVRRPASLAVRLWLGPADNLIYGQPLALIARGERIRLAL